MAREDSGDRAGPLGLGFLIASCGGVAVFGALDGHRLGPWITVPVLGLGFAMFLIAVRHLRRCCARIGPVGLAAYRAYNLGLSVACVAFSIIALAMLAILIARGELPTARKGDALKAAEIARVLWVSGMVAALGASFYCLRRMSVRFGRRAVLHAEVAPGGGPAATVVTPAASQSGAQEIASQLPSGEAIGDVEGGPPGSPAEGPGEVAQHQEEFVASLFWSGLWFRVAQAEVYTIVLFLVIWGGSLTSQAQPAAQGSLGILGLPVVALFMGLFVRAAEELVAGLAERLFAIARALLPRSPSRE